MVSRAQRKASTLLTGLQAAGHKRINRAGPFMKWAGGKSQLLASFEPLLPESFSRYFEPFTGGGALYFHLYNNRPAFKATLCDLNAELISCYTVVRDQVEELMQELQKHRNEESYYYEVRAADPKTLTQVERAARLIFLNKTCFNGLYRVNSKGQFNVPFGRYANPRYCDETNLRACSAALKKVDLQCRSFDGVLANAKKGDFVYFDPPYHPLSPTANFTSYTSGSFSPADQERLAEVFDKLARRGCLVMLSNSDTEFIRALYADYQVSTVSALRAINCKGTGRGKVSEVVVTNYL